MASTREGDIDAAHELGSEIAKWWEKMSEPKVRSMGVAPVKTSANLEANFGNIVESILVQNLTKEGQTRVVACPECKAPQIKVNRDRLIVTKGMPDQQARIDLAQKLEVESFLETNIVKTATSMTAQVSLIQASSGVVLAAEEFSTPNISLADTSMQLMFSLGIQYELNSPKKITTLPIAPLIIDLTLNDQVGDTARAGINLGVLVSSSSNALAYFMPSYGWKPRLGKSQFFLMPAVQAGLVYWNQSVGFSTGASLDFFLGKNFFVGGKGLAYLPLYNFNLNKPGYFAGFHFGFALGR